MIIEFLVRTFAFAGVLHLQIKKSIVLLVRNTNNGRSSFASAVKKHSDEVDDHSEIQDYH
jgi:hypothetical protein